MDDITENVVVRYEHKGITAGLSKSDKTHNFRCACKSVATDSNIYAGEMQAGRVQL